MGGRLIITAVPPLFVKKNHTIMAEEKKIEQPTVDLQEMLDSVIGDTPTEVVFRGKKHSGGWLR